MPHNTAEKKVALITGAGSGIGLFTSKDLAAKGWNVSIVELNEKAGQAAADEVNGIFIKTDVTVYADQANAFQKTFGKWGRIDFVFGNAGILDLEDFYEIETVLPPKEPNILSSKVNWDAAIYTAYLAMHYLRQNPTPGGSIIMTSSASALYEAAILPIYCGAKAGVMTLVKSLSSELIKDNIRINAILPGAVPTNIGLPAKLKKLGITPTLPDEMITKPEHILAAITELLDSETATGQLVEVSAANRYYRKKPEYPDAVQAAVMGEKESWAEKK
jgi:15-hydroxyprostaglandin dehydrogenase (NAD)